MVSEVIWTESAYADLSEIIEYQDDLHEAESRLVLIMQCIDKLKDFPLIGTVVREIQNHEYFEVQVSNYRVIFKKAQERIIIFSIIHRR